MNEGTSHNDIEILVVEDNATDLELTLNALKKQNLSEKVHAVRNGAEALDFIYCQGAFAERRMGAHPRVIFLDLKLPKVNGLEVLRRLKSDENTRRIPVVLLTSSQEESDMERAYDLGGNSYVVKPVEFTAFVKAISDLGSYWLCRNKAA